MTHTQTRIDRLRIERTIWYLDLLLADLPWRTRVAKRRELRADLTAAAADVGATEALHRLGNPRRLAAESLAAEYGDRGPRPAYWKGFFWAILLVPVMIMIEDLGKGSFLDGVATTPDATGVFHYAGLNFLGLDFNYTFVDGTITADTWSQNYLVLFTYMAVAFLIGGRMWRLLPAWRWWRQHHQTPGAQY